MPDRSDAVSVSPTGHLEATDYVGQASRRYRRNRFQSLPSPSGPALAAAAIIGCSNSHTYTGPAPGRNRERVPNATIRTVASGAEKADFAALPVGGAVADFGGADADGGAGPACL